jgi:hypothetical protein
MKQLPSLSFRITFAFTAVALTASWVLSAAGDATAPPVAVAVVPTNPQLADRYKILTTRSLFSKDGVPATIKYVPPAPPVAPATRPAPVAPPPAANPLAESNFVLKGVGIEDDRVTAFFEQTSEKKMVSVRAGGTVSQGQVLAMSLNGVDYQSKDKTAHIVVGQSLDGRAVEVPLSTALTVAKPSTAWNTGGRTRGGAADAGGADAGGQGSRGGRGMRGSQQDDPRRADAAATMDPIERPVIEEQPIEQPYIPGPSEDDNTVPIIIINGPAPEE